MYPPRPASLPRAVLWHPTAVGPDIPPPFGPVFGTLFGRHWAMVTGGARPTEQSADRRVYPCWVLGPLSSGSADHLRCSFGLCSARCGFDPQVYGWCGVSSWWVCPVAQGRQGRVSVSDQGVHRAQAERMHHPQGCGNSVPSRHLQPPHAAAGRLWGAEGGAFAACRRTGF